MPRVFDCLLLAVDDLDALEARFRALEHIPEVTHVIAEAPVSHDGEPKPLHFWDNRAGRYAPWHGRWTHVRVEAGELPDGDPGAREAALRDYLAHGLTGEPGDIILHGNVTDIPDPAAVRALAAGTFAPPVMLGAVIARHCHAVDSFTGLEEIRRQSA
jgi:hypothetical protein